MESNFDVGQMCVAAKTRSIKRGYNTLSNYAISYFPVFTHRHSLPPPPSPTLSLYKINYLGAMLK